MAVGLGVGLGIACLALLISGAGHGWNAAFISSVSVIGAPLSALAWSSRKKHIGFFLAITVLLGALIFDVLLWGATMSEGTSYVKKVWSWGPGWVLLWGALFASWQLLAASVVLVAAHHRAAA
jgi:hypothetical protein